jgi:hypothetical protein
LTVVLIWLPSLVAAASSPAAGGAEYEIPLNELKKVEKKTRKSAHKGRRERKSSDSKSGEGSGDASRPAEAAGQTAAALKETGNPANGGSPAAGAATAEEQGARIAHDPNSYVVVGKRTVVKAVISSLETFRSVRCQFRANESDGYAFVPMTREEGSRYTYTADLPPLAGSARFLRYRFVAVDAQGRVSRSKEFVIPARQSPVTPGWQREPAQEAVRVGLENPQKPLNGFSNIRVDTQLEP